MSPHHVLPEHLILGICYSRLDNVQALRDIGVRIRTVQELATLLRARLRELGLQREVQNAGMQMVLPADPVRSLVVWKLNVPSTRKVQA